MYSLKNTFNVISKMQKYFLFAICCHVLQDVTVTTQTTNTISTLSLLTPSQSNHEELLQSNLKETTRSARKDKLTCVLNLLKATLAEELEHAQCPILEESVRNSLIESINNLFEEEEKKIDNSENEIEVQFFENLNETNEDKAFNQHMEMMIQPKMESPFTKPKNNTDLQGNQEIPSMIPIFKPRAILSKNEVKQNTITDFKNFPTLKTSQNPRAVKFVPEKILQTSMKSIPNGPMFNIPCQRAADVLDMTNVAIPNEVCGSLNPSLPILNPTQPAIELDLPIQHPTPVTVAVNCADKDSVAMLFKPKTISLMQVYGNLLKEITITVLVPYHMSKLAA